MVSPYGQVASDDTVSVFCRSLSGVSTSENVLSEQRPVGGGSVDNVSSHSSVTNQDQVTSSSHSLLLLKYSDIFSHFFLNLLIMRNVNLPLNFSIFRVCCKIIFFFSSFLKLCIFGSEGFFFIFHTIMFVS